MAKPEEKTILVVDDEEDVRDYLSTVLEDAGFKVITAGDGLLALEKLKEQIPDFISLDLVMPNKSGMRFLREMRRTKAWSNIPFVIVTAHAHDDLGREDLNDILSNMTVSGPNIYLEKPVAPEHYVRLICERLGVELAQSPEDIAIDDLRRELANLVKGAGPDQLKQAIRALKKK